MHFVKQGAGGPWGRQATNCRLGYVPAILERRDISPGPVEPGGRGIFHYPDFDRIRNKTCSIKTLYAGNTKFSGLPPALNCFNAESNIQINVSLVSSLKERISNTKNYF